MIKAKRTRWFWSILLLLFAAIVSTVLLEQRDERTLAAYSPTILVAPAPPQSGGYAYRRTVTIDHTKVPNTDQTNFPILISGTYSYLATVANGGNVQNASGYDAIFTSDVGCATKLDHEVQSYSATTGAVNYWVRIPSLSHTTDTTIYLCYGNAAITTNQSNKTGVWDSNFKSVYHLEDQAASTAVGDSSANGTNGTNAANTSGKSVSGKLGRALTYNGTTDNTATGVTQTSSFTWECWFNLTAWTTQTGSSNYSTLMAGTYASGGALLMLWKDSGYVVQFAPDNGGGLTSGNSSIAPGAWHHAAYTRTGNSGTYSLYLDGVLKGQVASGSLSPSTTIMLARRADATAQALNGLLDETRISNVARSADWIKTEYNNQSSPSTFYTISTTSCCDTSTARLDPMNATGGVGENPLSRNFNWNLPLVQLPGRAGLDLSISLSYNSLVWTKNSSYVSFDDDRGFPSAGFRLGFPVIQPLYYNLEVGKYAFLLIGPDGSRTELRQVGSSSLYEAADSSHRLLDSATMVLRTTDGTQLTYVSTGTQYDCTQIKDRNGNYLTISYTAFGRIDTVTDTLARSIKFNYDANGWLTSITQIWNQGLANQLTHSWATFDYVNTTVQTNFSGLTVSGPANNSTIKTLSKVTLADGSHYDFTYSTWGQVWKVSRFAPDNHVLNYRSYNLPQTAAMAYDDCPRFTERHDWTENWNQNISGVEQEAITTYAVPIADSWTMPDNTAQTGTRAQVTTPDLTSSKIYFIGTAGTASGWQRGLPALVNTYDSSNVLQRQAMTTWTQDNTAVSYPLNPRVTETNIYDPAGNRARVQLTYQQLTFANGTSCQLPRDKYEYAANASTILRSTRTDYNTNTSYTDRRIIGLLSERRVYENDVNNGGALVSKVGFFYDNDNGASSIQGTDAPVQHDNTNYSANFVTGRANLSSVKRYDVTNIAQFTTTTSKYNTAGAVVLAADALTHTTQLSYADSFSDGIPRNTLAYPTTLTDPDNYTSTTKFNFDFGAVTYRRTPQPNTTQNLPGPEQTTTFDLLGRVQQVTNQVNAAYTRYVYSTTATRIDTYATIQDGLGEAHSFQITDGADRVIGTATDHPGSVGGYSGQRFIYDVMGRTFKTSNPTETSASGSPSQWTTAGDDAAAGWIYSQQSYDWKGRPLVTTSPDGTTKTASYAGCGCAGTQVVTLTDEGMLVGGVLKTRQQKIYSDVLGRTAKTEILDWDGTGPGGVGRSVYAATTVTYNALDQQKQIRQYSGPEGSATYQDTTLAYDGYARLQSKHTPEQDVNTATVWTYNSDDTVNTITDARGAVNAFSYVGTNRQLVKTITHTSTGSPVISASFSYDAAANRIAMTDGLGSLSYTFNSLSQLTSETRTISGVNSFTLSYTYNLAGELSSVTDPFGAQVGYGYDKIGRLTTVTGANFASVSSYASNMQYRAWGALKSASYGDSNTLSAGYDSNLRVSTYEIPGVMKKAYQYYNDGRLKFTQDQLTTNSKFDRSYTYDQVGRITSALSGQEARGGGPTTDRPYNEAMGYDPFGHLTSRTIGHWDHNATDIQSYTNNRRQSWQYDPDGRLLSGDTDYTFDAAGRLSSFAADTDKTDQEFDGDGRRLKSTVQSFDPETNQWTTDQVTYYIQSSVIGAVITEVGATGAKERTFVQAATGLLAIQDASGGIQSVNWEHDDASGASRRATNGTGGSPAGGGESDPLGADAGLIKPIVWSQPASPGKLEPYYDYPELNSPYRGCVADGVPTDCDTVDHFFAIGFVDHAEVDPLAGPSRRRKAIWVPKDTSFGFSNLNTNTVTIYSGAGGEFVWVEEPGEELQTLLEPPSSSSSGNRSQAKFDLDRFKTCIDKLYNVVLAPSDGRTPSFSTTRSGGSFDGSRFNRFFTVVTDMTTFTASDLRNLNPTAFPPGQIGGLTDTRHPYLNWLASDVAGNPKVPFAAIVAAQVHELGNSLAAISGRASPAQDSQMFRYDRDSGNGLTECVYGGFVLQDGTITTNPGSYQ